MSLADTMQRIVEHIVGPRVDALAAYPATVVAQASDGTLEVVVEGKQWPPMVGVPIRYGVPGVRATVRKGARVLVEFAAGDLTRPIATVWESASVEEITISGDRVRLADGDRPLVREGDPVVVILGASAASSIVTGGVGTGIPLTGYVMKGSAKVKGA